MFSDSVLLDCCRICIRGWLTGGELSCSRTRILVTLSVILSETLPFYARVRLSKLRPDQVLHFYLFVFVTFVFAMMLRRTKLTFGELRNSILYSNMSDSRKHQIYC